MAQSIFCGRDQELNQLKVAWQQVNRETQTGEREPQRTHLITLLAESGLGKTRLVQEFYKWLVQNYQSEGQTYWPTELSQLEQNLVVNPDLKDINPEALMPFLWWAIRLNDPTGRNQLLSSAVSTHVKDLTPHFHAMYRDRRRKQHLLETGKTLASTALDLIPGGGLIGKGQTLFELIKRFREVRSDKPQNTTQAEQEASQSLNELIVNDLAQLFKKEKGAASIPMVWVIDDGQFSAADPGIVELFVRLIRQAQNENWPLLVICTHWEQEWHTQVDHEKPANLANSIKEHFVALNPNWRPLKLTAVADDELEPILQQNLPGLSPEQQQKILARADGNPRFLEELIKLCQLRPRYFVGRNPENALSDSGFAEVMAKSTNLHALIEERLSEAPKAVQELISLSSLQGIKLLKLINQRLVENLIKLGYELEDSASESSLKQAQTPYAFINLLSAQLAEYNQRVFYEVAREHLADLLDPQDAQDALFEVLRELNQETPELSADEQELLLELSATLLSQSETLADRQLALSAYAQLCQLNYESFDYLAAYLAATAISEGLAADKWQLDQLDFYQLWTVQLALTKMGDLKAALPVVYAMQTNAESEKQQRNLSVSHNFLGNILLAQGDLPEALKQYQAGLEIAQILEKQLGTPETKRDLSLSYNKIGDILKAQGDLPEALKQYQAFLEIAQILEKQLGTPETKRDLSVSYNKIGDILLAQGDLPEALKQYQAGLEIRQILEKQLGTPETKRDLAVSCSKFVQIFQAGGLKEEMCQFVKAGLYYALEYQKLMPYQDAAGVVNWFQSQLEQCDG